MHCMSVVYQVLALTNEIAYYDVTLIWSIIVYYYYCLTDVTITESTNQKQFLIMVGILTRILLSLFGVVFITVNKNIIICHKIVYFEMSKQLIVTS